MEEEEEEEEAEEEGGAGQRKGTGMRIRSVVVSGRVMARC